VARIAKEENLMDFTAFQLTAEERTQLLNMQTECSISWLNAQGWPVAAVQSFVWDRGAFWVTSFRDRPRVSLLLDEPRSAVTVSSAGTSLDPEQMISARTLATVHDDDATADWFYPAFCRRVSRDDKAAAAMASAIAAQSRVIVELRPQSWNSFHGTRIRSAR